MKIPKNVCRCVWRISNLSFLPLKSFWKNPQKHNLKNLLTFSCHSFLNGRHDCFCNVLRSDLPSTRWTKNQMECNNALYFALCSVDLEMNWSHPTKIRSIIASEASAGGLNVTNASQIDNLTQMKNSKPKSSWE